MVQHRTSVQVLKGGVCCLPVKRGLDFSQGPCEELMVKVFSVIAAANSTARNHANAGHATRGAVVYR